MPPTQQLCTFYLEDHLFGVEVESVQEVIREQHITRVPHAPWVVRGLINLRGQIVVALDLRRRLGLDERNTVSESTNVVVRCDGSVISLLVDDIGDVVDVSDDLFEPPPETLRGEGRELIRGAYKLPGRLLLVLDLEQTVHVPAA
jgi:purine-binding chemotaxis protein CheW